MEAIIVVGPESSGTRIMTKILIACGAWGDHGHNQRMDKKVPEGKDLVVWRRSLPHGSRAKKRDWPDLWEMKKALRAAGYCDPLLIGMTRDFKSMVKSQVKNGHVLSEIEAKNNIDDAYHMICSSPFEDDFADICLVSYETLVAHPRGVLEYISEYVDGLDIKAPLPALRDENAKYY